MGIGGGSAKEQILQDPSRSIDDPEERFVPKGPSSPAAPERLIIIFGKIFSMDTFLNGADLAFSTIIKAHGCTQKCLGPV